MILRDFLSMDISKREYVRAQHIGSPLCDTVRISELLNSGSELLSMEVKHFGYIHSDYYGMRVLLVYVGNDNTEMYENTRMSIQEISDWLEEYQRENDDMTVLFPRINEYDLNEYSQVYAVISSYHMCEIVDTIAYYNEMVKKSSSL